MKTTTLLKNSAFLALTAALLSWCGCHMDFQKIDQQAVAAPGDTITVPIMVGSPGVYDGYASIVKNAPFSEEALLAYHMLTSREDYNFPIFSMRIPEGSMLQDPIAYTIDRDTVVLKGNLYHVHSMDSIMTSWHPPGSGYRWWSCMGDIPYVYNDRKITANVQMTLPDISGIYFIDYCIGYEMAAAFDTIPDPANMSPDYKWSYGHYLNTAEPQHFVVTNSNSGGPGSLEAALSSIVDFAIITFDLDFPATIHLTPNGNFNMPFWIQGPEDDTLNIVFESAFPVPASIVAPTIFSNITMRDWVAAVNEPLLTISGEKTSSVKFDHVEFRDNDGQLVGAEYSNLSFTDCRFYDNSSYTNLIGAKWQMSSFTNCKFVGNHAAPVIQLDWSNGDFCNVVFRDTVSEMSGDGSEVTFRNVTRYDDDDGFFEFYDSQISFVNSIFWPPKLFGIMNWNSGQGYYSYTKVSHSCLDSILFFLTDTLIWLEGNINEDPMFLGYSDHWCALQEGSPCIDAGTNLSDLPPWDLLGNDRIWDGDGNGTAIVDMGAYEYGQLPVLTPEFKIQNSAFKIEVHPNPTQGIFNVQFTMHNVQRTTLKIYDLHGRVVAVLLDEKLPAGMQAIQYDASSLPAGVYVVRMETGGQQGVVKMIKLQ